MTTAQRPVLGALQNELSMIEEFFDPTHMHLVEIGCGTGHFARRIASAGAASVIAVDLPGAVPARQDSDPSPLKFCEGRAEDLPLEDDCFDAALMMKSLHHVPIPAMDLALKEAARILKPGGLLIVCEPVAEGAFDAMIRPFHDERIVRRKAQEALDRCTVLRPQRDFRYLVATEYQDFDDFNRRMINSPTVIGPVTEEARHIAKTRYEHHASPDGLFREDRPFRCRILSKPKASGDRP